MEVCDEVLAVYQGLIDLLESEEDEADEDEPADDGEVADDGE